jgi:type IV secretion system protein TrbL
MRRRQAASHGITTAANTVRAGDHPSGGTAVDLSEE